ncbi:hypothetical protein BY458DRAFT_486196 [Sporodiniella umbellata]|nr:hypothetical protein BY458DRAFT_486196 [Sporodiniella umbellata]
MSLPVVFDLKNKLKNSEDSYLITQSHMLIGQVVVMLLTKLAVHIKLFNRDTSHLTKKELEKIASCNYLFENRVSKKHVEIEDLFREHVSFIETSKKEDLCLKEVTESFDWNYGSGKKLLSLHYLNV